jgi:hypothetical protein
MPDLLVVGGEGKLVELLERRGGGRLRFRRAPVPSSKSGAPGERPDALVVDLRSLRKPLPSSSRVREALASRLPAIFVVGDDPGTVRGLRTVIRSPHVDFVRMSEDSNEPADEIVERAARLIAGVGANAMTAFPSGDPGLRHTVPGLHAVDSGRLDAGRVANLLGVSLAEFARMLGKRAGTIAKTPDAASLQPALRVFERIAAPLLRLAGTPERLRAWLNAPNPALGGEPPMQLIMEDRAEAVAELVESIALGEPA